MCVAYTFTAFKNNTVSCVTRYRERRIQTNMHAVHSRENEIALMISNKILFFLYSVDRMDAEI